MLSVLDVLAAPLRLRNEKTYSEPFATRLYAKETINLPGGETVRDYPRLKHGGKHLGEREGDVAEDAALTAFKAGVLGFVAWLGVFGAVATVNRKKSPNLKLRDAAFAWDAVLLTLLLILVFAVPLFWLSGYYHVIVAGYFRGWVDDVIQYIYTVLNSIPGVLLIAAAVLMMQVVIDTNPQWFSTAAERADLRLLALCFILGITSWTGLCRLLRGETLKLRELEYIQAAQAFGVSSWRIIVRHILPNLMHIVIIALVMDFSGLVLAEAVLSYVGIGVDPTMTSFGTMINNARMELGREPVVWWSLAAAFSAMFILVLAANLFADAVRDAFDPRAVA